MSIKRIIIIKNNTNDDKDNNNETIPLPPSHCLVGLVVKASASRVEGPGFKSR